MENNNLYLKSLLNNPQTYKMIAEAWDVPVGSTKRAKASAIVTSIKNIQKKKSMNGQGGPSYTTPISGDPAANLRDAYARINEESKSIPQSVPTILKQAPQSLPMETDGKNVGDAWSSLYNAFVAPLRSITTSPTQAPTQQQTQTAQQAPMWTMPSVGKNTFLETRNNTQPTPQMSPNVKYQSLVPNTSTKDTSAKNNTSQPDITKDTTQEQPPQTEEERVMAQAVRDAEAAKKELDIRIKSGYNSSGIVNWMMNSPDILKALDVAGSLGIKSEDMPTSSNLSENLANAQKLLLEHSGVNDLMNQKKNMVNEGNYLTSDLNNYITNRDQFVKKIDSIIDKIQTTSSSYIADPQTEKANGAYLNFLYAIKGNQSKKYMDLITMAQEKYKADLASVDNDITLKTNDIQNELASTQAVTTERYNEIRDALGQFINHYATSMGLWTSNDYSYRLAQGAKDAASTAIEASNQPTMQKTNQELMQIFAPADGKTVDPSGMEYKIINAIKDPNSGGVAAIRLFLENKAAAIASDSATYGSAEQRMSKLNDYRNAFIDLASPSANSPEVSKGDALLGSGATQRLLTTIAGAIYTPLREYIDTSKDIIRSAVIDLSNDVKDPNNIEQINQWKMSENAAQLDRTFRDALIQYYKLQFRDPNVQKNRQYAFSPTGDIAGTTDDDLSKLITSGLVAAWGAEPKNI